GCRKNKHRPTSSPSDRPGADPSKSFRDSGLGASDRIRAGRLCLPFRFLPEGFHLLKGCILQSAAGLLQCSLHMMETAAELLVGSGQRRLGIQLEVATEVDERKQHVTELIPDRRDIAAGKRAAQLAYLLLDLVEYGFGLCPVEADASCLFLQFEGSGQSG